MNKKSIILFALALLGETVAMGTVCAGPDERESLNPEEVLVRRELIRAIRNRDLNRIRHYLENGGDPNFFVNPWQEITLPMMATVEVPDFVEPLLKLLSRVPSFDPNIANRSGNAAAHMCVLHEAVSALNALMDLSAFDPNVQGSGGATVLHLISWRSIAEPDLWRGSVDKLLANAKWDREIRDWGQKTAVDRLSAVRDLLDNLSDDDALNKTREFLERGLREIQIKLVTLESDVRDFAKQTIEELLQVIWDTQNEAGQTIENILWIVQTKLARLKKIPNCTASAKLLKDLRNMVNPNALKNIDKLIEIIDIACI